MKTIFNTTEKSNFILNMKTEVLQKIVLVLVVICAVCPLLGGVMVLFNPKLAYAPAGFLSFCGFTAILIFIVAILKKYVVFTKNISYFLICAYFLLAIISCIFPYDFDIALYGNINRFEGLFALMAYAGIFMLATLTGKHNHAKVIMDTIVGVGIVQALIGAVQSIPALELNSQFANLFPTAERYVYLPSGTSSNPIYLATFLTIAASVAIAGAAFDKNYTRRVVYATSAALFYIVSVLTCSTIGYIGIPIVFAVIFAIECIRIVRCKDGFFSPAMSILLVIFGTFAISFVIVSLTSNLRILDRGIAFQDGFYNLFVAGQADPFDKSFYAHNWQTSVDILAKDFNILLGTGPDCLFIPEYQMSGELAIQNVMNGFDKPYNHYLYVLVTRGIFSLLAYLSIVIYSIRKSFGGLKKFFQNGELWYKTAIFTSIVVYSIVIFVGVSSILVAPFFWIMLGLANAKHLEED